VFVCVESEELRDSHQICLRKKSFTCSGHELFLNSRIQFPRFEEALGMKERDKVYIGCIWYDVYLGLGVGIRDDDNKKTLLT